MGWTEVADVTNEELVVRIKAGIDVPENMLQLWEQTRAFIHTVALHYQGYADLEDLEQEGYLALYDAVDGYEPESGCKFLSYAKHWMRQRMKRYIDNCCQTVRVPGHEQSRLHQYRKMVNAFLVHLGRRPTEWEVTHNLNLDEKQRRDLESAMRAAQIGSLDAALQEGEDGDTVGDMVTCSVDPARPALVSGRGPGGGPGRPVLSGLAAGARQVCAPGPGGGGGLVHCGGGAEFSAGGVSAGPLPPAGIRRGAGPGTSPGAVLEGPGDELRSRRL